MSSEAGKSGGMPIRPGFLLVLSGPSGCGKSTLGARCRALDGGLQYSVSCTTRPPRGDERDGEDYYFLTPQEFDRRIAAGDFVEWAKVHGQRYGTPRTEILDRLELGFDVLLDIDVQGGIALQRHFTSRAVLVFVLPPSWAELSRRLSARGTDTAAEVARRLTNAKNEISRLPVYNYVVVNDDLDVAAGRVLAIVTAERQRVQRQMPLVRSLGYVIERDLELKG
jgi:guanylate kinase